MDQICMRRRGGVDQISTYEEEGRGGSDMYEEEGRGGSDAYEEEGRGGSDTYEEEGRGGSDAYEEEGRGGSDAYEEEGRGGSDAYEEEGRGGSDLYTYGHELSSSIQPRFTAVDMQHTPSALDNTPIFVVILEIQRISIRYHVRTLDRYEISYGNIMVVLDTVCYSCRRSGVLQQ